MKIADLMTRDVRSCSVDDNLNRPAQLMWEGDVGCVPVVDASGRLAGMITDRDIAMAVYLQGKPLDAIPVQSVMSKDLVSCKPGDDLDTALRQMQGRQVRRLPVVDSGGKLAGVVSLNDVARRAFRERGGIGAQEVAQTLARIGEPREKTPASRPAGGGGRSTPASGTGRRPLGAEA